MSETVSLLTLQFLAWVADRPRSYRETMEAWRSTCPMNSAWEDATIAGLVRLEGAGAVVLTAAGRATLDASATGMRRAEGSPAGVGRICAA
jgi:hypothetical protein